MGKKKESNKGRRGGEGEGGDKREEETVGGIICVCEGMCEVEDK